MRKVQVARPEHRHTALRRALAEPGRPLPEPVRTELEARFAADFRRVRIHTGSLADEAARSLDAQALTFGHHILFRAGMWRPETPSGFELVMHEAAHTLQQTAPVPDLSTARVSDPADAIERAADIAVETGVAPAPAPEAVVARRVAGIPARRSERADPARTIEEIGRALLERVRADSQDRRGRVRNQLIRMEDTLRRDVLQWLERRMESHEWRRFVELLAEPVPSGVEGTEDRQIEAGGAVPAEGVTESPAAEAAAPAAAPETVGERREGEPAPAAEGAAPAESVEAEAGPQEAAVAQPHIEGEQPPTAAASTEGGAPAPGPQSETGAAPVPEAPPAPAEQPAESAGGAAVSAETQAVEGEPAAAADGGSAGAEEPVAESAVEAETPEATETETTDAAATETPAAPAAETGVEPEAGAPQGAGDGVMESSAPEPASSAADVPDAEAAAAATAEDSAVAPSQPDAAPVAEALDQAAPSEPATAPVAANEIAAAQPQVEGIPQASEISTPAAGAGAAGAENEAAEPAAAGPTIAAGPAEAEATPAGGAPGAVPASVLAEFAGEPAEDDAAAPAGGGGGSGGGGGGGGGAAPESAEEQAPAAAAAPDNPVGAMQSIGTMRVGEASRAMGGATASVSAQMGRQRNDLASQPPTIERPTGSPQGAAGARPGNVPVSPPGPDPAPIPAAAAGQPVPLPPASAPPQPGAPVTQAVAPPRVTGTAQGQLSESDARRVQDAVNNVPVTDEALNVDAGAVPDLPLEGDADPAHADAQRTAVLDGAAATQQQGAQEAAAPMGEDHIYPEAQPGTIRPESAECACCGGQGAQRQEAGGAPDVGEAAVAEQEKGDEVRQAATGAAGELGQQQEQQAAEQQRANADSQQQVDQAIEDNARQQTDERDRARQEVAASRREWSEGQRTAVEGARTESDQVVGDARRDVSAEQTRAHSEAAGHVTSGNQEIARTRADSEQRARAERERSRREADGGILGWLASSITSFFNRLREAIHAVFDAARRVVRAAIETAQRLARGVIDLARRAVVGLIQAAGALLIAIGDRLLAAFPELRARFRAAIEAVVNAAVAAVNALADLLERGIMALLNALLAAINAILCAYEAIYMAIVNTVASAVQGAINFARAAIAALGAFAELVKDIAPNPGQWLRNLGASIMDGIRNHLWSALKTAVKNWFNQTIEGIIGMGRMLLDLLRRGGLTLRKIAGFVWKAILASLPGIIIQFLIERLISMLVPAAGAILLVIQGLVAAWGAVQRIIQALQLFFVFLKAVKAGGAGPQFAAALAASAVALIQFLAMFLMARLGRAAGGVAGRLRAVAQRLMAFFRRVGRAAGRVLRRVGRVVMRGARAVGRVVGRGLRAVGRVLRRTGVGRRILGGIRRIQRGLGRMRRRFRQWRERRRRNRERRRQEDMARAQRELPGRIQALLARRPSRVRLLAQLLIWRISYRLRRLTVGGSGDSYPIVAANSPQVVLVNGYRFPLHEIMRAIDEVAEEFLAQHPQFGPSRGPRHFGETTDDLPIGSSRGSIHFFGRRQEVIGMGRHLPQGADMEARLALLARGGLPRRGRAYGQLSTSLEGVQVGSYFRGMLGGYRQHPALQTHGQREALGSLYDLWMNFEPGHPYRRPPGALPGSLPLPTFEHRRDLVHSLMLTDLMQPEAGAHRITPQQAIGMHPAAFGGAQSGARATTAAMHAGQPIDPTGRSASYRERVRREKATLQAWFNANRIDCKDRPTHDQIKELVRTRLTRLLQGQSEEVAS